MITDGLKHITALLFLGIVLGLVALAALYLFAHFTHRPGLARTAAWLGLGGAGAYAAILLLASVSSRDRVLAPGEEKHICELDCHLAYSVAGVKAEPLPAGQMRHTVTVRVRFDKETISNRRALDLALSPNSRRVALVDAQGRTFPGSVDGLRQRLVPGESYTTDIVFAVPADARELRLILRSNDIPTPFIIGHENSLFHGKTTFALGRES